MITIKGKEIIAKCLINQVPSAFSYIALGVGAQPQTDSEEPVSFSLKTKLDFEALRIPISSVSTITENQKTKIVLSATIPAAGRYDFSEVGIFSAKSNSLLTTAADRLITYILNTEGWVYQLDGNATDISTVTTLSTNGLDFNHTSLSGLKAFFVDADKALFYTPHRKNQRLRIGENGLFVIGNLSTITGNAGNFGYAGANVELNNIPINLSRARPTDEIKLSLSLLSKLDADINDPTIADGIKVSVKFTKSGNEDSYAALEYNVSNNNTISDGTISPEAVSFVDNGYYVVLRQLKDFRVESEGQTPFSWATVNKIMIYVTVDPGQGRSAGDYYVGLDAIRFDSNNNNNPTYGLVGYSAAVNNVGTTIIKSSGAESQVEYKIPLEIG